MVVESPRLFTEKSFYLREFRERTLALAAAGAELRRPVVLEPVLKELEENLTRVVLISNERDAIAGLLATPVLEPPPGQLEGSVWRALRTNARVGLALDGTPNFLRGCREIALGLGVSKLVWLDAGGGVQRADGARQSFVDLAELGVLLQQSLSGESPQRETLLQEIDSGLRAGLPAVNLCTPEGLADELFSYAGSGTLFTRESYVEVRRLGIDDFEAAEALIARGVAEGFLAPRAAADVDLVLGRGYGAFVEGRHLAGIGALVSHPAAGAGEIVSLYTLTRFLGEGVGGHLIQALCAAARAAAYTTVFACTTTDRVVGFFERQGFGLVAPEVLPEEKWRGYDPERRARVRCLKREL